MEIIFCGTFQYHSTPRWIDASTTQKWKHTASKIPVLPAMFIRFYHFIFYPNYNSKFSEGFGKFLRVWNLIKPKEPFLVMILSKCTGRTSMMTFAYFLDVNVTTSGILSYSFIETNHQHHRKTCKHYQIKHVFGWKLPKQANLPILGDSSRPPIVKNHASSNSSLAMSSTSNSIAGPLKGNFARSQKEVEKRLYQGVTQKNELGQSLEIVKWFGRLWIRKVGTGVIGSMERNWHDFSGSMKACSQQTMSQQRPLKLGFLVPPTPETKISSISITIKVWQSH